MVKRNPGYISRFCCWLFILIYLNALADVPAYAANEDDIKKVRIPTRFHHGLIFAEPVTLLSDTLRFFLDTADGTLLYESAADRLDLKRYPFRSPNMSGETVRLPAFKPGSRIPVPKSFDGRIPVRPDHLKPPHHQILLNPGDGVLGSNWFAGCRWVLDYLNEEIYAYLPAQSSVNRQDEERFGKKLKQEAAPSVEGHTIPIFFRDESGEEKFHLARLQVVIQSDTLCLVLKTGSHVQLPDAVRTELQHPDYLFPAGMISESIFQRWRSEYPDWKVYPAADTHYGSDMIQVPEVQIGNYVTGPVHFSMRREETFKEWLSRFTDERVVGALGPDAFRQTRITLDYLDQTLTIQPQD